MQLPSGTRQLRRLIDNQADVPRLAQLIAELRTYPELEQEIHRCIDERGQVVTELAHLEFALRQVRNQITRYCKAFCSVKQVQSKNS